jgi:hypothetical protein
MLDRIACLIDHVLARATTQPYCTTLAPASCIDRCVEDNDGSIYSSLGPGQLATVARGRAPVPDSSGKYDKKEESVDSIGAAEAAIGPLFLGALGVRGTRARGRTRRPPAARAPSLSAPTAQTTQQKDLSLQFLLLTSRTKKRSPRLHECAAAAARGPPSGAGRRLAATTVVRDGGRGRPPTPGPGQPGQARTRGSLCGRSGGDGGLRRDRCVLQCCNTEGVPVVSRSRAAPAGGFAGFDPSGTRFRVCVPRRHPAGWLAAGRPRRGR